MAYTELSTEDLEWEYFMFSLMMSGIRHFLKAPCCEECKMIESQRLKRHKIKLELITIELLSRVDFQELESIYQDLKIDHINTVRHER